MQSADHLHHTGEVWKWCCRLTLSWRGGRESKICENFWSCFWVWWTKLILTFRPTGQTSKCPCSLFCGSDGSFVVVCVPFCNRHMKQRPVSVFSNPPMVVWVFHQNSMNAAWMPVFSSTIQHVTCLCGEPGCVAPCWLSLSPQRWSACCTRASTAGWASHTSSSGSGPVWCAAWPCLWASTTPVLYPSVCTQFSQL